MSYTDMVGKSSYTKRTDFVIVNFARSGGLLENMGNTKTACFLFCVYTYLFGGILRKRCNNNSVINVF